MTRARHVWTAAAALAAIPVAVVYARPLHGAPNYDEQVYLATMGELRHGVAIGDVFLSQPPGFGWFLASVGAASSSLVTVRGVMIAIALLGCVAAWFVGRHAAGAAGGAITAATLAIAPPWPVNASLLEAEVPSTVAAIGAIAFAPSFPALAGAALVLAISLKLLAVSAAVPVMILARKRLRALALGAAVATLVVTVSVATHLGQVWDQTIVFHLHGRRVPGPSTGANADRLVHFLDPRTPFAVLALAAIVLVVVAAVRRQRVHWALWTWPVAAAATLVVQHPLLDHHMELDAAAWALPVGATLASAGRLTARRPQLAAAAVALFFAAGLAQQWRHLAPRAEPAGDAVAVAKLRSLVPTGSLVASDLPILPYRAGDDQPPQLVDLSSVRLASGTLSPGELLRDARGAKAFLVGRALASDAPVVAALRSRYRKHVSAGSIEIYADPR